VYAGLPAQRSRPGVRWISKMIESKRNEPNAAPHPKRIGKQFRDHCAGRWRPARPAASSSPSDVEATARATICRKMRELTHVLAVRPQ
jgi:hypothetical protein